MFTNLLSKEYEGRYLVHYSAYAQRHFLKGFEKRYKGQIWEVTRRSIAYDLERIHNGLQFTQQVDELWHKDQIWIFKYDFAIARSGVSAKKSGNRCICRLDDLAQEIEVLMIYSKTDLPKNMSETAFVKDVLEKEWGIGR